MGIYGCYVSMLAKIICLLSDLQVERFSRESFCSSSFFLHKGQDFLNQSHPTKEKSFHPTKTCVMSPKPPPLFKKRNDNDKISKNRIVLVKCFYCFVNLGSFYLHKDDGEKQKSPKAPMARCQYRKCRWRKGIIR